MPLISAKIIAGRIAISSVIYAIALAAAMAVVCVVPDRSCRFAPDSSVAYAMWFMAILLTAAGLISMGAILSPVAVVLRKFSLLRWWLVLPLGAVAGTVPLLFPCLWAEDGCVPSQWIPEPAGWFAFAGLCGGLYLWLVWLRHLTHQSRADAR
jgi:hypothetical protein